MKAIELLAPAKNLESGKVAINYGADAVYIGADRFGARAAAGNSISDIETLVQYAHLYGAKVFVTLNTILFDHELEEAERLIHEIYQIGADALIIQDMGILKMDIPPIPLHASTQMHNFNSDRIQFLDQLGLERIVLARELSLEEIRNVRNTTSTELEFFIHGALCVSLSGQCYFSQAVTGRSANRGMCAQMCRHPYHLVDGQGQKLKVNSHLLSLKDLNMSNDLKGLIEAGISSLKIEGRLKDINYVKNVVSYYRKKLDEFFAVESKYFRASSGKTAIQFEPDPERSFNRGATNYFFSGRKAELINAQTPKSMGKKVGVIENVGRDFIIIRGQETFHNGDGLCFISKDELLGIRVEKVLDSRLIVNDVSKLVKGMEIYRNYDHEFNKMLEADQSIRKIAATITLIKEKDQLHFQFQDEDQIVSEHILDQLPEIANNTEAANRNLITQLSKSGNSVFDIKEVNIDLDAAYFFRISELNEIRRLLFEKHEKQRILSFARKDSIREKKQIPFPQKDIAFSENISNQKAAAFYREHGVEKQEKALEISSVAKDQLLMTTRYCIKYEMGFCERFQGAKNTYTEPLYLQDQNRKYILKFDCKNCLMQIRMQH